MKLSGINLHALSFEKDLIDLYQTINDTKTDDQKNKSIVDVFEEIVTQGPLKTAVRLNEKLLSYRQLDERSNQVANWLLERGIHKEAVVAIYFDRSIEMIISMMGILKAGAAYLPLNISYPTERNRFMLNEAKASVLMSSAEFIREVNELQWLCPTLTSVMAVDSFGFYEEIESVNPLMKKELWEYIGEVAEDDIAGGGWKDSYTADKFSREVMDEYASNVYTKLKPYLDKSKKVLEIGCASGITMYKIAPEVKLYYGTDLSDTIITYNQERCNQEGIENIRLACLGAKDIDHITDEKFDVIIINSVIQAFNGLNYLRQIIRKASGLLNENGIIFIGDVMDLELKDALLKSVHDFKILNPNANTKLDFSNELFVSRYFFEDCKVEIPSIQEVTATPKIFTISNELTDFRYDVILRINKVKEHQPEEKYKYQFDASTLDRFTTKPCGVVTHADQLSHIIFTSGSTGMPKGVMIEHHCILRLVLNSNFLDIKADDNLLQTAEVSFDPSCMEIFGTLLNGATLCLVTKDILLDSDRLYQYMISCDITILQLVSALFHTLSEQNPALFSAVRKLIIGGEVLSPKQVKRVREVCPQLIIINAYGPTENCVVSTSFEIDDDYETIPIGKPISNSGIYIFNDSLKLQPVGIVGELYLSGDGLSRGYLNSKELNAEKFITNPYVKGERLYRTGDLVRLKPDLNLEFIGRKDLQVKIQGHRVELTEIENALKGILHIDQVKVAIKGKNKILCAYIVTPEPFEEDNLKQLLSVSLPGHMVPRYIIQLDQFPLNSNGKTDYNILPEPAVADDETDILIEARNETEQKVLAIFKEVLEKDKISITQNFFQLGGHSLLATQVLSRINKEFNISLPLRSIFNDPTTESLAAEITKSISVTYNDIVPVPVKSHYDLSHAQQRLWILNHMQEYKTAYNMLDVYQFKGLLDREALLKSFRVLILRHEILRTVFEVVDGHPQQRIIDFSEFGFDIEYQDLQAIQDNEAEALKMINNDAVYQFDLEKGPLFRVRLLQIDSDNHVFVLLMHHIISDGWSLGILINELLTLYNSISQKKKFYLEPLVIQYKDYVEWQGKILQGPRSQELKEYWTGQFSGHIPELNLPLDFKRSEVKLTTAEKIFFSLPVETSEALKVISEKEGVTLFMALVGLLSVLLYKITDQTDVIIGTPIAGRNHKALENQIGIYINTLVLRTKINTNTSFKDYLTSVKEIILNAYEHQMYPFDALVEDLNIERKTNRSPLFDVGFTWQNVDVAEGNREMTQLNEIKVQPFNYNVQQVKTDIWFHGWEGNDSVELSIAYNVSLFKRNTIDSLISDFQFLAKEIVEGPARKIQDVIDQLSNENKRRAAKQQQKVMESKFDKFIHLNTKPISLNKPLVVESLFSEEKSYPFVIKPNMEGLILSKWIAGNKEHVRTLLLKHGGILFRNFNVTSLNSFQEVAAALSGNQMAYMDQSSPRTLLSDKTYTSTDHPEDQVINMHNELSYSHDWPMQIMFFCLQPSLTDGETPIADSRIVLQHLSQQNREKFAELGILYVRNLVKGFGLSWQEVYQTSDRNVVEKYCTDRGITYEWTGQDNLRISWKREAIHLHPLTQEEVWFNHGFFFNAVNLDESIQEAVGNKEMLPFNTFYGDGSEIEPAVLAEIRNAYENAKISFKWKQGDIIVLDNMLMAHGRNSYTGERKILVAMNDPYSQAEEKQLITSN